jgi:6-phosphogluconolactonase (cycloisomerase 2 family)
MKDEKCIAYIGTYTYGESKGIYKFTLNLSEKVDPGKLDL